MLREELDTYKHIHSIKRSKLTPQQVEDLVYFHTNLRLLSRRSKKYSHGESRMWDLGGDGFESFDGAGILEGANLSLDEPELGVMSGDDDNKVNVEAGPMEVGSN